MPLSLWRFKELVRSMSLLSPLFSILSVRRVCLHLSLPTIVLLLSAGVSQAQAYGDFKVVGTGADAGISFEFLANQPLLTPGLQPIFSFVSCTVPAGETCNQAAYGATGGQIRLTTISGPNVINRTWFFPHLLHTGVYIGQTGAGFEPGYVILSGADATAGQPQSNAISSAFQFPIEVTVNDSAPTYQNGVTVTFTAPGSGPTASFPNSGQATTDGTGRARITPTADGTPGAYQITATATVGGNTFQTSFVAANVNPANATGACQVTTANDDFSAGSLRYQIAACGKGGTITFASGINTVNVEAAQDIPLTQDLTIDGGSGVTINGSLSRIFFITGGTITLRNLTLQGGTAAGGAGGTGYAGGGGAAGMGGAIFVNAGSLVIDNVTFTGNQAVGGNGGSFLGGPIATSGGGGGVGGPGGSTRVFGSDGNGGGGGDFGSSGGGGDGISPNGSGDGAGGGGGGSGAFAGGGSAGGQGAFGGGGAASTGVGDAGGTFGASGGPSGSFGGGGGAGLGGAIFMRNGTLSLTNATFISNGATGGISQSGGGNGQGKGGALYISSTASAVSTTALPTFSANSASNAGTGTACNTVEGANALDTNDICGILTGPATHFSVSAPASVTSFVGYQVTVTALDGNNNVVTGYTGTVHLTSTDPGFANGTGDSTLTNGVGTFNVEMKQAGTQTITATDTVNGSITGTSNDILVNPGPPAHVIVSAPGATSVGAILPFTVTVSDLYGNPATGYSGTLHFTSSDAAAVLPADSGLAGGTGSFNATLKTTGTQTITATDTVTTSLTGTSNGIAVSIPGLVVTTTADSGVGSLRAALATAAADGSGNITFDPTVFATPQTITLTSGTLNIPSNATITGATSGSGTSLRNLVTVNGGGSSSNFPVFTVNTGVTGAAIANLTIANGHIDSQGGGILNEGSLTVTDSMLANNYAGGYAGTGNGGGAIFSTNNATLTIVGSTFTGNTSAPGGAIGADSGQVTITNSTFYGNSAIDGKAGGAIFINSGTVSVNDSTFSGNSAAGGGGIFNNGTLTVENSILSGNSGGDCGANGASTCPTNGSNGNVVGASNLNLAPPGNYGGPTQTMIPLPGSVAICAGSSALIPVDVTNDQRGFQRTNTTYTGYSSSNPCVDAGAVQTNYQSVQFSSSSYSGNANSVINPAPVVSVTENGENRGGVPITLNFGGTGTASGLGPVTTVADAGAAFAALSVNQAGSDTLSVTLPITTGNTLSASANLDIAAAPTTTTASNAVAATNASAQAVTLNATVTSSAGTVNKGTVTFTVLQGSTVIGVAASGGVANGNAVVSYTLPGSTAAGTYTIQAAYTDSSNNFAASSDNTHTLTVNPGSYELNVAANNSAWGTVSPASGASYAAGSKVTITATAASGYYFVNWTGSSDIASTTSASTTITMNGLENVTANFAAVPAYVVTVNTDTTSGVPGNCVNQLTGQSSTGNTDNSNCSLRDAVAAVDLLPSGVSASVSFASSLGSVSAPGTIVLTNGPLSLTASATITGLGTTALVIDGNNNGNILQVQTGVTASVSNLTMQHAVGTPSQLGGAIVNLGTTLTLTGVIVQSSQANLDGISGGGGIYNGATSTLTIMNSTIYNNSTSYFGGTSGYGGGILNEGGNVSITSSTLAANSASLSGGNIYTAGGTVSIDNSTITESNSTGNGGGLSVGGGTVTVTDSTIAANRAASYPGILVGGGTVTVTNSIVAGNTAYTTPTGNCSGCTLHGNNIVDVDPQLSVIGSYGGGTQTFVPLPGSPALCAGTATADTKDQRGYSRPNGSCYDIGAVQTKYAIAFAQQPTDTLVDTAITPAVTVTTLDHGNDIPGVSVNLTLNGAGTLSGTLPEITDTTGTAAFPGLKINAIGTGDTLTASASSTLTVTSNSFDITGNATSLTLASETANPVYGSLVTFKGAFTPASASVTSSNFQFVADPGTANQVIVPAPSYANGTVTVTYGRFSAGSHTALVKFLGTTEYASTTSNAVPIMVAKAQPTVTWGPASTIGYGTNLSALLTAKGTFNSQQLQGTVTYSAQTGSSSAVSVTGTTVLNAGTYTLTATFTPTDTTNYQTARQMAALTVTKAPLTVTVNNASKAYGAALPSFTGTITGIVNGDNITATYTTTATASSPVGTYPVTATLHDLNERLPNYAVTIHQGTLTVTQYTLTVTANNATRAYGTPNPAFTGTVTGAVSGDSFTESFTTTATQSSSVGTYPIVPSVTGTNLSDYTVVSHNGTLTITQAASITTLTASNTTISPGQNLTLTVQVKSATTGTPTGSVNLYDGSSLLNTATLVNGTAAYTTTTLGSGSHALTAVYAGDTNFTASNSGAASTVTVGSLDFTISVSGASSQTVIPGRAVNYAINVTPLSGMYPGQVNFSISGLPSGATGTFSPASIAANGGAETVSLTIQTASASANNAISPLGLKLAPIALGLLLLPFTKARRLRTSGRTLRRMLCLALLLTGGAISPGVLSGCGSSNGFLGQTPKNYTVTVTATSGTVQHTTSVNLNLQ
jgi:hypothetical protein